MEIYLDKSLQPLQHSSPHKASFRQGLEKRLGSEESGSGNTTFSLLFDQIIFFSTQIRMNINYLPLLSQLFVWKSGQQGEGSPTVLRPERNYNNWSKLK